MDAELSFHIDMRTREFMARGMREADARAEAIRCFGDFDDVSSTLVRIAGRTEGIMRRARFVREAISDARVAVRMLKRRRAYAALAIGTMALGIGAATAIFSVVDGVLMRPLPFDKPDEIVSVWLTQPSLAKDPAIAWLADATPVGNEDDQAFTRDASSFRSVAMFSPGGVVTLTTDAGAERIRVLSATSTLLPTLRVRPQLGRAFTRDDNVLNGPNVVMITWETWRSRFGGDSTVIGRKRTLDDKSYEVIGVLPEGLEIDRTVDAQVLWLPALRDSFDIPAKHNRGYRALARLAPGVPLLAATAQAARIIRTVNGDTSLGARVDVWQHDQTRAARGPLLVLLGAAGLLLLIACVNVAVLQLGEAAARAREMATRAALGAGVARLVRQLLAERVVVAALGAVLGTALSWFMLRGLVALSPERLPGLEAVSIDQHVLLFAMLCALVTGVLFGIIPALLAGRSGATEIVRSGAGESGRGARVAQRTLVAVQLARSMALLVDAALLARSLRNLGDVDPGFHPTGLVAIRVSLPRRFGDDPTRAFTDAVMRRLRSYPGVEAVTAGTHVPFVSGSTSSPVALDRMDAALARANARHTQQRYVLPGYFEVLGMKLLSGRFFSPDDRAGNELVAVVSAAEVARDFGGVSPIGRQVKHQGRWRRIVGVVAGVKYHGLAREDAATIYVPFKQLPDDAPTFVIRAASAVTNRTALAALLHEVEPRATLVSMTSVPTAIATSYAAERYRTVLVSAFGVMAALLAVVGLYGVSIRSAKRRTRELGIRLALGSTSSMVVRVLVTDAMAGVAVGFAVGIPAALLAGRAVSPYLFGVSAKDPVVFVAVGAALVVGTALATALPAMRAARLNPAVALREE